jgi:hypothetical protein
MLQPTLVALVCTNRLAIDLGLHGLILHVTTNRGERPPVP